MSIGDSILEKNFDSAIENLEKSFGIRSGYDEEERKEILKLADEALERQEIRPRDIDFLELSFKRNQEVNPSFLRKIGFKKARGELNRQDALNVMEKSLKEGKISWRRHSIMEDRLNKHLESPQEICKALDERGERLEKSEETILEAETLPDNPTRQDALNVMSKALSEDLITFREHSKIEDGLNRRRITPQQVVQAIDGERKKARLHKGISEEKISNSVVSDFWEDDLQERFAGRGTLSKGSYLDSVKNLPGD